MESSLDLIEPVNFPLYEFSGRGEGEDTPKNNQYMIKNPVQ